MVVIIHKADVNRIQTLCGLRLTRVRVAKVISKVNCKECKRVYYERKA